MRLRTLQLTRSLVFSADPMWRKIMTYQAPRITAVQTLEGALEVMSKQVSDADVKHNVQPTTGQAASNESEQ